MCIFVAQAFVLKEKSLNVVLNTTMEIPSKVMPIIINATFSAHIDYFDTDKIRIENGFINNYKDINDTIYSLEFYPYDTYDLSTIVLDKGAGVINDTIYSNKSNKFFPKARLFVEDLSLTRMNESFKLWWENFQLYQSTFTRYLIFSVKGTADLSIAFNEDLGKSDNMYIIRFYKSTHSHKMRIEKIVDGEIEKYEEGDISYSEDLLNTYEFWDSTLMGNQMGLMSLDHSSESIVLDDDTPHQFNYFSFSVEGEGRSDIEKIDFTRNSQQMIIYMEFDSDTTRAPITLFVVSTRPLTSFRYKDIKVENCFVQSSESFPRNDRLELVLVPRGYTNNCTISNENPLLTIDGEFYNFTQDALDFDRTYISSYHICIPRLIGYDMMYKNWGTYQNTMIYSVFTLTSSLSNPSTTIGFFSSLYNVPLFYRIVMNESTTIEICYTVYCQAFASVNYTVYQNIQNRLWSTCDTYKNSETVIKIGRGDVIDEDLILNYTITDTVTFIHYFSFSILNDNEVYITDIISNHIPYPIPTDPPPPVKPNYNTVIIYIVILIAVSFILMMAILGVCVRIAKEEKPQLVIPLLNPREYV